VKLRKKLDIPLTINSAYRCPQYNASLNNSSPTSYHQAGSALDISISNIPLTKKEISKLVIEAGFTYHYFGDFFVHIDVRNN